MLAFNVKNQTLSYQLTSASRKAVANGKSRLKIKINFLSKEWDNQPKYILFTHNGETYKKFFGIDENCTENEMYVPREVVLAPGFEFRVGCNNSNTLNSLFIEVEGSDTENIKNQDATPSVVKQMNQLMHQYAVLCNNILQDCQKIKQEIVEMTTITPNEEVKDDGLSSTDQ